MVSFVELFCNMLSDTITLDRIAGYFRSTTFLRIAQTKQFRGFYFRGLVGSNDHTPTVIPM